MRALGAALALGLVAVPAAAVGDTLFLQGRMAARVAVEVVERYDVSPGTSWMSLRARRTPSFGSTTWRQTVVSEEVRYSVRPGQATVVRDGNGNDFQVERWEQPRGAVEVVRRTVVDTEVTLGPVRSQTPFPLPAVPADVRRFLNATAFTQRDDPGIREAARRLTAGARTEQQAVTAILNFVVDHLQYHFEPQSHTATYALETRSANCQGYAHLAIALLRAAGVPARVASGVSLSKGWRVTHTDGTLTLKMGQGRHAWVEIFYPDLGWIPYDPQTSQLFVSLYHVRQAIGLDADEIVFQAWGSPAAPALQHTINGDGANETFGVKTVSQTRSPRNFVVSSEVREAALLPPPPPVVSAPPPVTPPPAAVNRAELTRFVEFGNLDFPASLRLFGRPQPGPGGVTQVRSTYIVETADYATGPDELAQAFTLREPLLLSQLSLALQKFGGSTGELWIDLHADRGRRPGARIAESRRLPVAGLVDRGGYRWVVFDVVPSQQGIVLQPGRYWAVFRSRGDGIFNWYFSLGNAYGEPDDSRSSPRGVNDWSNILNYRFNFRVAGLVKP